jgi:hypothetical protein
MPENAISCESSVYSACTIPPDRFAKALDDNTRRCRSQIAVGFADGVEGGMAKASFLALRVDLHSQRACGRDSQLLLFDCGKMSLLMGRVIERNSKSELRVVVLVGVPSWISTSGRAVLGRDLSLRESLVKILNVTISLL